VVELILLERRDSEIHLLMLAVFSVFNCLLKALISSKRKAIEHFSDLALASK
jgi:hypothetical protein